MPQIKTLLVDDEKSQRELIAGYLSKQGFKVITAGSGEEALKLYPSLFAPVALIDMKMPGMNGLELLRKLKDLNPFIQVIVLTAFGSIELAVECMRAGAFDFLTKPIEELNDLQEKLISAAEQNRLVVENQIMKERLNEAFPETDIIGDSGPVKKVKELISTVAEKDATVLITGPSGTGKELVARAIHSLSSRKNNKLVTINCAAFPENLLESELFGYEKGAFTGADKRKLGRFELADGGTLFLDEIGEMPLTMQVKLLRALENRTIQRLGSESTIELDIRLIAATNRNLKMMVDEKTFRDDLFYRLNVIEIELPPLKDRGGDILILARAFIDKFKRKFGKPIKGISDQAASALTSYSWPGNVRELENVIERAMVLTRNDIIDIEDIPGLSTGMSSDTGASNLKTIADVEKNHILNTLESTGWSLAKSADMLGIHRNTLRSKIKEYNLIQPE